MRHVLRVLGIDPGTFKMGVGVVDSEYGALSFIFSAVLSPVRTDSLAERLYTLHGHLSGVIQQWQPSVVAVEKPFVAHNVRAAMAVGQAQAVAMMGAAQSGLSVFSYTPTEVKKAVTDYGASSKAQVQAMVKILLGLPDEVKQPPDAADALAVALCHDHQFRMADL